MSDRSSLVRIQSPQQSDVLSGSSLLLQFLEEAFMMDLVESFVALRKYANGLCLAWFTETVAAYAQLTRSLCALRSDRSGTALENLSMCVSVCSQPSRASRMNLRYVRRCTLLVPAVWASMMNVRHISVCSASQGLRRFDWPMGIQHAIIGLPARLTLAFLRKTELVFMLWCCPTRHPAHSAHWGILIW